MAKKTKQDVIEYVHHYFGFTLAEAEAYVEATIEGITKLVTDGHELHIKNFGRWQTVEVAARTRKHPMTHEAITTPAHRKIKVKNLIDPEK